MSTITKSALKTAAIGAAFGLGLTLAVTPMANAVTNDRPNDGKCYTPSTRTETRTETHYDTVVIPGKDPVIVRQELWGRDVEGKDAEWLRLTQYSRTVEVPTEITIEQWLLKRLIDQYQFSRTNPGQEETYTNFYKYQQVIPAKDGVKTYKWKTSVDDYKVKNQYQKMVKGVIQKKSPYGGWVNTGETFGWTPWEPASIKWSFDDKEVLESGPHNGKMAMDPVDGVEYRMAAQAYQYTKTGKTEQVKTGSHWDYQWGAESPGDGWIKTDTWKWETEPQPEQTILYEDGAWVKDNPGAPWVEYDHKQEGNDDAIAPFTEYRAQDGSATPNQDEAGTFDESSFEGWEPFGEPSSYPVYVTRDENGVFGESRNPEDAAIFTAEDAIPEHPDYTPFGHTTVTKPGEPTYKTVYLTGLEGALEETENPEEASWLPFDLDVPEGFAYVLDSDGEPVLYEELVSAEEPGYFEYWRLGPDGNVLPTRVLTESNWFDPTEVAQLPSKEDGWEFLRERNHEAEKGTPDEEIEVGTSSTYMVEVSYHKEVLCTLPATGGSSSDFTNVLGWATGAVVIGGGLLFAANRRQRRLAEATQGAMNS